MIILIGTIVEISKLDPNKQGFDKKIITITGTEGLCAFVEFKHSALVQLEAFQKGDSVIVAAQINGSISKKSDIKFNNIIAKSIKRNNGI